MTVSLERCNGALFQSNYDSVHADAGSYNDSRISQKHATSQEDLEVCYNEA